MIQFNHRDFELISSLLKMASEKFADHGCNDLPTELFEKWSQQEMDDLAMKYHQYNDDAEAIEQESINLKSIPDWALMNYYADQFKELSNNHDFFIH